jgi:UDP-N-acetyl-D-mannosaminuronate dehydrogenase
MQKTKDIVAGLGEIGGPIFELLSKPKTVVGYDVNKKLMNEKNFLALSSMPTDLLHICIPFTKKFIPNVLSMVKQFSPKGIVIHSTIEPNTTKKLQQKLSIPVIYSATRGVHKRMLRDLKRYTKFYAIENDAPNSKWAILTYEKTLMKCGVKTKKLSTPLTLELAKIICDTSYYGWLITYAQLSNMIAINNKVNYDEMWSFADEIHKFLGNRPKMYPGIIGGHCVIPNLDLINDTTLNFIKTLNKKYAKKISKNDYYFLIDSNLS